MTSKPIDPVIFAIPTRCMGFPCELTKANTPATHWTLKQHLKREPIQVRCSRQQVEVRTPMGKNRAAGEDLKPFLVAGTIRLRELRPGRNV